MNMQPNAEFLKRLLATFLVEAREHVQAVGAGLLDIEKAGGREAQTPLVETLFREVHSLKGAARAVTSADIERLCQALEDIFGDVKAGKRELEKDVLDVLHTAAAVLEKLVEDISAGRQPDETEVTDAVERLMAVRTGTGSAKAKAVPAQTKQAKAEPTPARAEATASVSAVKLTPPKPAPPEPEVAAEPAIAATAEPHQKKGAHKAGATEQHGDAHGHGGGHGHHGAADTVRIATSKLDTIFVQAEELLGVKMARADRATEVRSLVALMSERERLWSETVPIVRYLRTQIEARSNAVMRIVDGNSGNVPIEMLSRLLSLVDQDNENAEGVGARITALSQGMADDRRRFDAMSDRLLDDVMKALMLPFSTIIAGFPKMMHDLARDTGKEAEFSMFGADIEIDKRILESMKTPLMHLLRNVMDHGIEAPAERKRRGKPAKGKVVLAISQVGGKVEIQITDDGGGVDVEAVKAAAIKTGAITAAEAEEMDEYEARNLVFRSGVSTSREVTHVSGRGLGMAIVHENVTKLGGTVVIETSGPTGTMARIVLPSTLATLRGTVVNVSSREFVVPTVNVARVVRVLRESVRRMEGRESFCLDGTTLSLVRLSDVLAITAGQGTEGGTGPLTVLVLRHGHSSIAFAVDQVVGEQEVLAKPLGRLMPRVQNIAGATVFGTNRVVPILNVPDLLLTAVGCKLTETGARVAEDTVKTKRLLVVDDSITTRTMIQLILESAGYIVTTAPDGAAAFNMLHTDPFDLVVSDVEMPRMDGFELTKRVRSEPKTAALPVVLVTARDSKEDRERGIDAGANAYIVKGSFDQSNLLEVIGRLI